MKNIERVNRKRNIQSLIASILVVVLYFFSVVLDGGYDLKWFTTWTNILCAVVTFLTIPYEVDGLRKNNFHLPNWIVVLLLVASTGICFVLLFIATFGLVTYGFDFCYGGSALFTHLINPLLTIILTQFLIKDHYLGVKETSLSMIPISVYCTVYYFLAIKIGYWDDFYSLNKFVPFGVSFVVLMPCAYGLARLIRFIHNKSYQKEKERVAKYYMECNEFNQSDITVAIEQMAGDAAKHDKKGNVVIPRRTIALMKEKYQCKETMEQLCNIFVKKYFATIDTFEVTKQQKGN